MKNVLRLATVASLVSASVLGGIAMRSADAATITWGSATTISGTTDVNTEGTLFAASSFGSNSVTVNGVTFDAWSPVPSGTAGVTSGNFTLLQPDTGFAILNAFGSSAPPFSGLPTEYQNLLSDSIYSFGPGSSTVTVSGLTNGQEYSIQFWANDSRPAIGATQTVDGITLDVNTTNADGGVGQWIRGTFTADASFQNFNVSTVAPAGYYSAIQVRAVPEPSSLAGLGVVGAGLAAVIRRRLRAAKSAS